MSDPPRSPLPPPAPRPEPLEALRARYLRALAQLFDVEAIKRGQARRPAECSENVFDCENGIRLIISRERLEDGRRVLHFSASFAPGSRFAVTMRLRALQLSREELLDYWREAAGRRFERISGDVRPHCFVGWSIGHVAHFVIELEAAPAAGDGPASPPPESKT